MMIMMIAAFRPSLRANQLALPEARQLLFIQWTVWTLALAQLQ